MCQNLMGLQTKELRQYRQWSKFKKKMLKKRECGCNFK